MIDKERDAEISDYEAESDVNNNQSSFISENVPKNTECEKSNLGYEGIYSILINRYNQEVSQKSTIRNQSVFILTAMGFLVTSSLGIISADWFDLTSLSTINNVVYIILTIFVCACFLIAISCLVSVGIIPNRFYWKYPDNTFLADCSDRKIIMRYAFDTHYPLTNITALSEIIQRNQRVNHLFRYFIIASGILLIISFIIIVIILGILLIENYNSALLNNPLTNLLIVIFCT